MTKKTDAKGFLAAMSNSPAAAEREEAKPTLQVVPKSATAKPDAEAETAPAKRLRLKHFGAYLEADTLEKAALLRVRLGLDNSGLVKLAIEELAKRHDAKRTFGDA